MVSTKQYLANKKGMTVIEVALAILIMGIVIGYAIKAMVTTNENLRMNKERHFAYTFDKAMKTSAALIMDAYEPVCSTISGDAVANWGWGHSSCNKTSPFPAYNSTGTEKIVYNLQLSNLSATASAALVSNIAQAYAPYCAVSSQTTTKLELRCANLRGLTYDIGGGPISAVQGTVDATGTMTANGDINPTLSPSYTITYNRVRENGNVTETSTYNGALSDFWVKRRNYSLEKLNKVSNYFKAFNYAVLTRELENTAPTGLNSTDDEFVPWFWEAFGDYVSPTASAGNNNCTDVGGTCTNLNTNNIWRSGNPSAALIWRRTVASLGQNDSSITIDGFGNEQRIIPIMSQCTAAAGPNQLTTCTTTAPYNGAPAVPADSYFSGVSKPPYTSVIFSSTCANNAVAAPAYCRYLIAY